MRKLSAEKKQRGVEEGPKLASLHKYVVAAPRGICRIREGKTRATTANKAKTGRTTHKH
jgi:hypothetical protein